MSSKQTKYFSLSLELYITLLVGGLCLVAILLAGMIGWQHNLSYLWLGLFLLCALIFTIWLTNTSKRVIISAFQRASLQIDAILQDDYNQIAKAPFKKGIVADFHSQLRQLSKQLLEQKSHYDQQAFLVYQLIAQLDTPVLVFNAKHQLSFGNDAFTQLYNQPWQLSRHASASLLGLERNGSEWHISDEQTRKKWQIKYSEFIDDGEVHHLLVFINLEPVLRESQLAAWQQLIRVLGHEIRNSLTPVSSMAETLANRAASEREKMALDVISERCHHLQSFVERYASVSKPLQVQKQWIDAEKLITPVIGLFNDLEIINNTANTEVYADSTLIEQVLINVFKNAKEAQASQLELTLTEHETHVTIDIIDNGQGFANLDNLFVPLYTTKADGNGIGLSLCRNIVEQHSGTMLLINNPNQTGVTVTIQLPNE